MSPENCRYTLLDNYHPKKVLRRIPELLRSVGIPLLFLTTAAVTGCGPKVVLENPEDWPAEWRGRQLHTTRDAKIYASNIALAGEADGVVRQARRHFARTFDANWMPGVVIICDPEDPIVHPDPRKVYVLRSLARHKLDNHDGQSDDYQVPTDEQLREIWEHEVGEARELGFDPNLAVAANPFVAMASDANEYLDLPFSSDDDAEWVLIVPSRRLMGLAADKAISAVLGRENIPFGVKALIVTIGPVVRLKAMNVAAKSRAYLIEYQLIHLQRGWSREKISQEHLRLDELMEKELGGTIPL